MRVQQRAHTSQLAAQVPAHETDAAPFHGAMHGLHTSKEQAQESVGCTGTVVEIESVGAIKGVVNSKRAEDGSMLYKVSGLRVAAPVETIKRRQTCFQKRMSSIASIACAFLQRNTDRQHVMFKRSN